MSENKKLLIGNCSIYGINDGNTTTGELVRFDSTEITFDSTIITFDNGI